ncbi:MAG: GntR family transcriptional regulator [Candidatus Omnitrophica bacterium]|nr:GntR family transcriptional regulator [Candidatus Omnitrophota bacterium]
MYKHLHIMETKRDMKVKNEIKREYGISLHYQIRLKIEDLLQNSSFSSTAIPTEEILAKDFGVSRGTVRRALTDLVNQGVLYRIPGKGTFLNKKTLSTQKIVIFSPWLFHKEPNIVDNTYEDVLLRTLRKKVMERNSTLILKNLCEEEIEFLNATKESIGMIIMNPTRNQKEIIKRISSFSIPAIVIGANLKRKDIDYVASDNERGMKKAIEYLISLGIKNLFFIGGSPESFDTDERLESFKKICKEKLIDYDFKVFESDANWRNEVINLINTLYKNGKLPEGFITGGINLSLYIYEGLKMVNKDIGKDISVVGFDDFPICRILSPQLTTIKQPLELMAEKAIELLEERIKSHNKDNKQIILPTELIIRNSCKRR